MTFYAEGLQLIRHQSGSAGGVKKMNICDRYFKVILLYLWMGWYLETLSVAVCADLALYILR